MPGEATTIITSHLSPGERLLWAGRPKQGLLLRGEDAFLIPFSLIWSLPVLSRLSSRAVLSNPIDLLFLVMGLYLLVGRFIVDAWLRSRTYYGVTDRHGVIIRLSTAAEMQSVSLTSLSYLKLTLRRGGTGTIEIGRPRKSSIFGPRASRAFPFPGAHDYLPPAFEAIPNAREVYDLIVRTQQHTLQAL
ncbi:conserved protein of unknown function [Candidatus Promineifilum breve]|uniref:DUF304 domain-containing protein n=1 Tax=Candidatus Promineifilum breve TaxID=1806508 RepID=A0A160T2B7_9CHLR|nr:hypothetical protein [Candidatus Promineifilum breve]CUS03028.2 conserved protein of unknown function [Candidatus Promineifilum breve]